MFLCELCRDEHPRLARNCPTHEKTQKHQDALKAAQNPRLPSPSARPPHITHQTVSEDALRALLASASSRPQQPLYPHGHPLLYGEPNFPNHPQSPPPVTGINWGVYSTFEDTQADLSPEALLRAQVCQATLDYLNGDSGNISDFDNEGPDDDDDDGMVIFFFLILYTF